MCFRWCCALSCARPRRLSTRSMVRSWWRSVRSISRPCGRAAPLTPMPHSHAMSPPLAPCAPPLDESRVCTDRQHPSSIYYIVIVYIRFFFLMILLLWGRLSQCQLYMEAYCLKEPPLPLHLSSLISLDLRFLSIVALLMFVWLLFFVFLICNFLLRRNFTSGSVIGSIPTEIGLLSELVKMYALITIRIYMYINVGRLH